MASNLVFDRNKGIVEVKVNPKLYPLDVVYSAAYVFLDRAYALLKGNPAKEIIVELKPKSKVNDLEKFGNEFNDQLLNYANYKQLSEKNLETKQMLLHEIFSHIVEQDALSEPEFNTDIDDPDGILIPWEEKYGKKAKKENSNKTKKKRDA